MICLLTSLAKLNRGLWILSPIIYIHFTVHTGRWVTDSDPTKFKSTTFGDTHFHWTAQRLFQMLVSTGTWQNYILILIQNILQLLWLVNLLFLHPNMNKQTLKALKSYFLNQILTMNDGVLHEHNIFCQSLLQVLVISRERVQFEFWGLNK